MSPVLAHPFGTESTSVLRPAGLHNGCTPTIRGNRRFLTHVPLKSGNASAPVPAVLCAERA